MINYDEELQKLRKQVNRKAHLEKTLGDLYVQRQQLAEKVRALESIKLSEQADVDRLEQGSLTSFFYNVVGKLDEKLSQERQEAYAAAVKYDAAYRELSAVEGDISRFEAELRQLADCETRYDDLLAAKADVLKATGNRASGDILALEARITYLERQMDEIDEAIVAGRNAQACVGSVMDSLNRAGNWSTFDMFSDGIIADIAKHSNLDDAQRKVEQLQIALRRFKTELADVTSIHADLHVSIDGFLRFADYFFDNLFTDWAVMDQINRSKAQVQHTAEQINHVLVRLDNMMDADQREWKQCHDEIDSLVLAAQI